MALLDLRLGEALNGASLSRAEETAADSDQAAADAVALFLTRMMAIVNSCGSTYAANSVRIQRGVNP